MKQTRKLLADIRSIVRTAGFVYQANYNDIRRNGQRRLKFASRFAEFKVFGIPFKDHVRKEVMAQLQAKGIPFVSVSWHTTTSVDRYPAQYDYLVIVLPSPA